CSILLVVFFALGVFRNNRSGSVLQVRNFLFFEQDFSRKDVKEPRRKNSRFGLRRFFAAWLLCVFARNSGSLSIVGCGQGRAVQPLCSLRLWWCIIGETTYQNRREHRGCIEAGEIGRA